MPPRPAAALGEARAGGFCGASENIFGLIPCSLD